MRFGSWRSKAVLLVAGCFGATCIAGCSREPSADDLRAVVLTEVAKAEGRAGVSDSEAFGSATVSGSSPSGANVAYSLEIPRGRRLYVGEVLYEKGWLKFNPLQVDVKVKTSTVTLPTPPEAAKVWQGVQPKYRIFVHSKQPLTAFNDFAARPILVALTDDAGEPIAWPVAGFEGPIDPAVRQLKISVLAGNTMGLSGPVPAILAHMARFLAVGGVPAGQIEIQSVTADYEKAFSADERRIAVMVNAVAGKLRFGQFSDLAEVVIR